MAWDSQNLVNFKAILDKPKLYRNTKVKVRSPDGDTEYFDIVAGVLQGDTLSPYLFIICLDHVLRTSTDKIRADKEKKQTVPRKNNYRRRLRRWHSDTGKYTQPSRNTTAWFGTSSCRHRPLCQCTQNGMCYNQTDDISTLDGTPLKLVDKFTYLGSSVASTEKDIDTRLTKAWTAINRLSIIWK